MFSQTVEYALRAAVYLADQAPNARTTEQIAKVTRVPHAYLAKVLQALTKGGIVRSQRGIKGGFSLKLSASSLSILEIVNTVDPICRIETCPLGLKTHRESLCPLHHRLDQAVSLVEAAFRSTTLAEVLADPSRVPPLCEVEIPSSIPQQS